MAEGRLHPRLLRSEADRRYGDLVSVALNDLRAASAASDPAAVYAATGAPRVADVELEHLQEALREAADAHGFPDPPARAAAGDFDRAAARVLLESARLFPAEATAPEVWSFHALILLPDVAFWRWRNSAGSVNRERIVASDLTRHALGRLWWRGYLLCAQPDGSVDLEGLAALDILGEADFDHIQARRRAYGASPRLLQRLVKMWKRASSDLARHPASEREILRDLLKRLLRLGAFIRFDLLADEMLDHELRRALDETLELLGEDTVEAAAATAEGSEDRPSHFDDLPLRDFVPLITLAVTALGPTRSRDLASALERHSGVEVPPGRERWVKRFAWVAKSLQYLRLDSDGDIWSPGAVSPAPDLRWGDWTIIHLRQRARGLQETSEEPLATLLAEVYRGPRPSRLARDIAQTVSDEAGTVLAE